ncbi:hypothetical protein BDY21DRAFT_360548 [Lineolata rhizophorae]|uniref:Secreted protein n=1 Tax=Lineolata rhizophorae TaxID=578093 RepID=A0A6A6PBX5_9PEZI|nr:hypothetical protein BDY21DRAFT_360548 [Lineolata rhizophorae]
MPGWPPCCCSSPLLCSAAVICTVHCSDRSNRDPEAQPARPPPGGWPQAKSKGPDRQNNPPFPSEGRHRQKNHVPHLIPVPGWGGSARERRPSPGARASPPLPGTPTTAAGGRSRRWVFWPAAVKDNDRVRYGAYGQARKRKVVFAAYATLNLVGRQCVFRGAIAERHDGL